MSRALQASMAFVCSLTLALCSLRRGGELDIESLNAKMRSLKSGMTRDEVRAIVGQPADVDFRSENGRTIEVWTIRRRLGAASNAGCTFDAGAGRLLSAREEE